MSHEIERKEKPEPFSRTEQQIMLASKGSQMIKVPQGELIDNVTDGIRNAYIALGHNVPGPKELALSTKLIMEMILKKYPFLTVEEFNHVMFFGACGDLGDSVHVSVASVNLWIRTYLEQKKRPVMAKFASMKKDEEKPIDTKAVLSDPDVQKWRKEIMDNVGKIGGKHKASQPEMKGIKESEEERELRALCKTISKSEITGLLKEYQPGTWTYQILTEELERKKIAELPPPGFPII